MVAPVLLAAADCRAREPLGAIVDYMYQTIQRRRNPDKPHEEFAIKVGACKVFHGKVAALTPGAVGELGLRPGEPATAVILASHLILGVLG